MKISIDKREDGFTVHIDRLPLPEDRFKAVCSIAAAGVYAGLVIGVAALCGGSGLLLVLFGTVLVAMLVKGLEQRRL